ncbi:methyltransferase domain-containing protein [Lacimicrobium sp. SS2-24]|uniref:methyltransferase domain-containing protein n=1 Tax=Lacimicrobium sp. SS2-24 TaxID=2005569 RepID=UPI000B4AC149|nr:methyltransferase domain-containing protein [Lacimicrobium sp. SS2-24]
MYNEAELKQRIARQFSKAAEDYDHVAGIQRDIASHAMSLFSPAKKWVMDLGCGTGRISAQLAQQATRVIGVDIAAGMVNVARQRYPFNNLHFEVADAENLPLADSTIDGVFSSMALQWCQPLEKVMQELYRVMKPGARGVLAIMAKGSLAELNQSWLQLAEPAHVNSFEDSHSMCTAAIAAGFDAGVTEKCFTSWHTDIFAVLHSIKDVGAGVLVNHPKQRLSRKQLQRLQACYSEHFAQDKGLPLSYQVTFLEIQKQTE